MIDANRLDPRFKDEIAAEDGGENIKRCFSCGTCTASCPIREITDRYNPRRIIRMAILGLKEEVLSSDFIWLCSACYTCHERCPQDVRITDLMNAIKNMAIREGYVHPSFRKQVELLGEHGRLYEIGEFENQKRSDYKLPTLQEQAADIQKIFEATDVAWLVEA